MHDQMQLQMFTYNKHFQEYQKNEFVMVSAIIQTYLKVCPKIVNLNSYVNKYLE